MPRVRNNIKVISISSLFSPPLKKKKKNLPCFPFLSWDNNYLRFADGDLTADYECSLTMEGISALICNNRIKLSSFEKKEEEENHHFWESVFLCAVLNLSQAGWR